MRPEAYHEVSLMCERKITEPGDSHPEPRIAGLLEHMVALGW